MHLQVMPLKRNLNHSKQKICMMLIGFILKNYCTKKEKIVVTTQKLKCKKYKSFEKKASGMDAFIIVFFLTLLRLHMIQLVTKKELTI